MIRFLQGFKDVNSQGMGYLRKMPITFVLNSEKLFQSIFYDPSCKNKVTGKKVKNFLTYF